MKPNYNSQEGMILKHLKTNPDITPLQALNLYGVFRLGARIFDLKAKGYPIKREWVHNNGKKWASYRLEIPRKDLFV